MIEKYSSENTITTMRQTLGEWIKKSRKHAGWSIQYCADKAGVIWQTWQRLEKDEPKRRDGSMPQRDIETLKKVALVFNVPLQEILDLAFPTNLVELDGNGGQKVTEFTYEDREKINKLLELMGEIVKKYPVDLEKR